MSVRSIVGGGVRLVRTQPQTVSIWAALYLAAMTVGMVVMRPWTAAMLAFQQQASANAAAGIKTPPAFPAEWFGLLFLCNLVFLVLLVIAFAAVVRAIARPAGDRFAYLRLGMDELRLIGLGIVLAVAAVVAETIAILALVLVGVVVGLVAGKAVAAIIVAVLVIALLFGAIYVEVRLSLAGALTVMRGRIVIRDAWRTTRGHFWTLFGVFALLAVMFTVVTIIVIALTNPHLLAAYASFNPQTMAAAGQEQIARQGAGLSAGMIVQLVISAITGALMGAVGCGAIATAALELSDAEVNERGAD
jgi:hypothetical protein